MRNSKIREVKKKRENSKVFKEGYFKVQGYFVLKRKNCK